MCRCRMRFNLLPQFNHSIAIMFSTKRWFRDIIIIIRATNLSKLWITKYINSFVRITLISADGSWCTWPFEHKWWENWPKNCIVGARIAATIANERSICFMMRQIKKNKRNHEQWVNFASDFPFADCGSVSVYRSERFADAQNTIGSMIHIECDRRKTVFACERGNNNKRYWLCYNRRHSIALRLFD